MRKVIIDLIRCQVVKGLMEAFTIVKAEPPTETGPQLGSFVKGPEVEVMVLEHPPQPLNENIVLDSSATVHADSYAVLIQYFCKGFAGKLGSLISIKNFSKIGDDRKYSNIEMIKKLF